MIEKKIYLIFSKNSDKEDTSLTVMGKFKENILKTRNKYNDESNNTNRPTM